MKCSQCNVTTNLLYFNYCEECYAMQLLAMFPPSLQDIKIAKMEYCVCEGHYDYRDPLNITPTHKCGRCNFINKYWHKFKGNYKIPFLL